MELIPVGLMQWRQHSCTQVRSVCVCVCVGGLHSSTELSHITMWVKGLQLIHLSPHTGACYIHKADWAQKQISDKRVVAGSAVCRGAGCTLMCNAVFKWDTLRTVFTLMVSSGCPAKTRQTPPNPPAKKFFRGLIGVCPLDIFTFRSAGIKKKQRWLS